MSDLVSVLRSAFERIQELERRTAATGWKGKVTHRDTARKLIRVELGKDEDGNQVLSPWVPYSQVAGALKVHSMPSIGQTMALSGVTGDIEQAVAIPFHWSDANGAPSDDGDTHVLTIGDVRAELTGGGLVLTVGGVTFNFTGAGFAQDGGSITHNGTTIDDTHKHTGVEPGAGLTDVPA